MPPVKSIDLRTSAQFVPVGGTATLEATPVQANGKASGAPVSFVVVSGAATVTKTGNQTATATLTAAGQAVIRATCGSTMASLTLSAPGTVTPPPPPPPAPDPDPVVDPVPTPSTDAVERIFGARRVPASEVATRWPELRAYDDRFPAAEAAIASHEPEWTSDTDNYYGRDFAEYAAGERLNDPHYLARGDALAVDYRDTYVIPNNYVLQPHQANLRGLAIHALRTGDAKSRTAVLTVAERVWEGRVNEWVNGWNQDLRMMARTVEAQAAALDVGGGTPGAYWPVPGAGNWKPGATYLDRILETIRRTLAWQIPTGDQAGRWPGMGPLAGVTLPYQVTMWHETLAVVLETRAVPADLATQMRAAIRLGTDYLWRTQWRSEAEGFNYASDPFAYAAEDGTMLTGGPGPSGDLTGMYAPSFAYDARLAPGDATRRARALTVFRAGIAGAYLVGSKQFNEFYASSWRAFAWLP